MKETKESLIAMGAGMLIVGIFYAMAKAEYQRDSDMLLKTVTIGGTRNVKIVFEKKRITW